MNDQHCSPAASRRAARRKQVLDAAERCFRAHGFHAASMAKIAETAGMSVGHIYRYFPSKEEVIAAIVAAQLAGIRARFERLQHGGKHCREALADIAEEMMDIASESDLAAMFLEVQAEAVRNPRIAEVIRDADADVANVIQATMAKAIGEPELSRVAARAELFSIIFAGLSTRTLRPPGTDDAEIRRLIRGIVEGLFAPAGCEGNARHPDERQNIPRLSAARLTRS